MLEKIKEMLRSNNPEMQALGKNLKDEFDMQDRLGVNVVKELMTKYPCIIVTGSLALLLHGIRLQRWYTRGNSDIDLVIPHYIKIDSSAEVVNGTLQDDPAGIGFHLVHTYGSRRLDLRIDPYQRYEVIHHEDFDYKVSMLEDILAAKIKLGSYNPKHIKDIYEICGKKIEVVPIPTTMDGRIFTASS